MLKDEFLTAIREIGTCEDDVTRRDLLATLQNEVSADYDNIENLTTQNQELLSDNESLRSANMKLFLQVGEQKSQKEQIKNETGLEDKKPEKRKFEDLFNEKGSIK